MITTYLVLSKRTQQAVDVFLTKEEAERMIKVYEKDDRSHSCYEPNNYFTSPHSL